MSFETCKNTGGRACIQLSQELHNKTMGIKEAEFKCHSGINRISEVLGIKVEEVEDCGLNADAIVSTELSLMSNGWNSLRVQTS